MTVIGPVTFNFTAFHLLDFPIPVQFHVKIEVFAIRWNNLFFSHLLSVLSTGNNHLECTTRVGTLILATIYLQLIQNRYMFRSFTVLQCSHQYCVQPVASDVEVVGYL